MQSQEGVTTNLVECLDWRVARRDESRMTRRLWKKQAVDAISSLEAGAIVDECVHFLNEVGVLPRWQALPGEGIQREMVNFFPYVMRYGMKTLSGMEAMNALLALLFSDEAAMRRPGAMRCRCETGSASGVTKSDRARSRLARSARTPWPTPWCS